MNKTQFLQVGIYPKTVKPNHLITFADYMEDMVSCFDNVMTIEPRQITLKKWITACTDPQTAIALEQKSKCLELRATGNKALKRYMLGFSPGAVMISRDIKLSNAEKILHVTGWAQFDIDPKGNPHIKDWAGLRDQLSNFSFVAFCSLSSSGKGVWGLIKVLHPENYKYHFEQLKIDFASRGIKLDSSKGGNPTDLRFYSYDPQAYIAVQFKIYDRIYKPVPPKPQHLNYAKDGNATQKKVERLIKEIQRRGIDIAPDYNTYLKLGFAFAHEFGEFGRFLFHAACSSSPKYHEAHADKKFNSCLKSSGGRTTIRTFYYLCSRAGVK